MKEAIILIIFYKLLKLQLSNHIKFFTKISCKDLKVSNYLFRSNQLHISFNTKKQNYYIKLILNETNIDVFKSNKTSPLFSIKYEDDEYLLLLKTIIYIISDSNPALRASLCINFPVFF